MAVRVGTVPAAFDPTAFECLRFVDRDISEDGVVTLRYALDDSIEFVERFELPEGTQVPSQARRSVEGLLALLHWVAGVSYFKTAVPAHVRCEAGTPPPATAALLEALYSEGLGEFAFRNRLSSLPRPEFPSQPAGPQRRGPRAARRRVLVPVGGGKDSAVALEIVRRAAEDTVLFSVGDAPPIARTAEVAGLPRLVVRRRLDPGLSELNRRGALNGHVPITAIVSCVALLTAALHGFDAVAMANERSASSGNVTWDGVEVNHQFSKSRRAERLLGDAVEEATHDVEIFSVLRPASELAIARAFARMERYHPAFTSCNTIFRLDPELRGTSWCCDCPKCRFVFLVLAPFSAPSHLREVFGRDLLDEDEQFAGFALLTATGGHKPFECVGEEQESIAAIRLLADDPSWSDHRVVRRLVTEVLSAADDAGDPVTVLSLADDHDVPPAFMPAVSEILGA
jgi:hypothetical protein